MRKSNKPPTIIPQGWEITGEFRKAEIGEAHLGKWPIVDPNTLGVCILKYRTSSKVWIVRKVAELPIKGKFNKLRELGRAYFEERSKVEGAITKAKIAAHDLDAAQYNEEAALHKYLKELERLVGVD